MMAQSLVSYFLQSSINLALCFFERGGRVRYVLENRVGCFFPSDFELGADCGGRSYDCGVLRFANCLNGIVPLLFCAVAIVKFAENDLIGLYVRRIDAGERLILFNSKIN